MLFRSDWELLLDDLDALGVSGQLQIDLGIVRGLAYYTGFVFEVFAVDEGGKFSGRALAGGGRYDHLTRKLGFPELPAVGFGVGDVMLSQLLQERGRLVPLIDVPQVYCVLGSTGLRKQMLRLVASLRSSGYRVAYPLKWSGFGKQFKLAGQSGARLAMILGEDEAAAGVVKMRDMQSGEEEDVGQDQILDWMTDRN